MHFVFKKKEKENHPKKKTTQSSFHQGKCMRTRLTAAVQKNSHEKKKMR